MYSVFEDTLLRSVYFWDIKGEEFEYWKLVQE
jgi:hypothetical protein